VRRVASLAIALVTAGCVNVEYIPTNAPPRPMKPRPAAEVEVFPTGLPSRPYVEVARLEIDAQTNDPEMLIDQLRQEAGERGCEGVVFAGSSGSAPKKKGGFHALCIVYRDPR
jgi:hypothetical protein